MKKQATVITPKCPYSGNKVYGIRIEKRNVDWVRTWSFPMREDVAKRENFSSQMNLTNFTSDSGYPGCPYCSSNGFIQCGKCKKISCWKGENISECAWCGNKGQTEAGEWDPVSAGGY